MTDEKPNTPAQTADVKHEEKAEQKPEEKAPAKKTDTAKKKVTQAKPSVSKPPAKKTEPNALVIRTKNRKPYTRCGIAFGHESKTVLIDDITVEQYKKLESDHNLMTKATVVEITE